MRTYDLVFDTKMPLMPAIYARQNDAAGAVVLNIQVVDNGKPVTLGDTMEFRGLTADKQYVISDRGNFTNLDKTNGSFSYAIPNQICAVPGRVDVAYFSVVDAGGRMSTLNLTIIVEPAGDLSPQHAKDYISVVDNLEKVVDDKIESASKELTDSVSTLQSNVDAAVQSFKAADFYTKAEADDNLSAMYDGIMADVDAKKYVTYDVISEVPDE